MKDAAALIQAIAWPLVALVALFILRRALPRIVEGLSGRVTRISVFEVSIELATVPELRTTWQAPGLGDVRQPTPAELFDSPAVDLLTQFHDERAFDYALVDLGEGRSWLSSRLFVFAEMLPRLRGLRCFVFVEGAAAMRRRLLGIARPEAVRWALARQYPWLELALEQAYAGHGPLYLLQSPEGQDAISSTGAVQPNVAQQIGRAYLEAIQEPTAPQATPAPPAPSPDTDGWVPVPQMNRREHATWLNGAAVQGLLGASLQDDAWVNENRFASDEEHTRAVLGRQGDFVAIVRGNMTFRRLVDRRLLLEELVTRQLRE